MNNLQYVFSQIVQFLGYNVFNRIVGKYEGNKRVRCFSCRNQLLLMMFGQLSGRESLSDTVVVLKAHARKCYHLGIGQCVEVSTVSRANEGRDYRIFEEFAMHVIGKARRMRAENVLQVKVEGAVYAFDSSVISLCLSLFRWAKFKSADNTECNLLLFN